MNARRKRFLRIGLVVSLVLALGVAAYTAPLLLALRIQHQQAAPPATATEFPVTVDPAHKQIVEDDAVNRFLTSPGSPLEAAAGGAGDILSVIFERVAAGIASLPLYQSIAAVDGRFVTITPGMRKEQVAAAFGDALGWSHTEEKSFLTPTKYSTLPLPEGSFSPGVYYVEPDTTPLSAQSLVNDRFSDDVLAHYGTTTAALVPLDQALTVASLIQREAGGTDNMRLISGIIWKRLFAGMNLQLDATVQYAKANKPTTSTWWPRVLPADTSIKSAYNTYVHAGLPPTPIANPSVAAILAALNPLDTSCLFYFSDRAGAIHCSDTYQEHVALLKKYYGHGR